MNDTRPALDAPSILRHGHRAFKAFVWAAALLVTAAFTWMMTDAIVHGASRIDWSFLVTAPRSAGRAGGIAPILVATGLIVFVAVVAAVPIALATAIFLSEFVPAGNWIGTGIGLSLDILAGIPSIVFGLFGNAFFCVWLGLGFSILSGGLTLACMTLPILIRSAETGLRMIPREWRHGAAALGLSRATSLRQVFIPAAAPALMAGLMLGIGRAMAETAALIFTSGYVDRMPASLLDSGRAISVHIYDLAMNVAGGDRSAYASALVLVALLIVVNSAALWLAQKTLTRRITAS